MTDKEFAEALEDLQILCSNAIGFHHLSELPEGSAARRVMYQAQAYAAGLELAFPVCRITENLAFRDLGPDSPSKH